MTESDPLADYEMHSNMTEYGVSIHAVKGGLIVASAEASFMGDHWYTNRVVVLANRAPRGQGIGGKLLGIMLEGCVAMDRLKRRKTRVVVTPGGYGADPKAQFRFYEAHGFKPTKQKEMLEWRPTEADAR